MVQVKWVAGVKYYFSYKTRTWKKSKFQSSSYGITKRGLRSRKEYTQDTGYM